MVPCNTSPCLLSLDEPASEFEPPFFNIGSVKSPVDLTVPGFKVPLFDAEFSTCAYSFIFSILLYWVPSAWPFVSALFLRIES